MIAGVGKTFRMLQDAHEMLRCGTDVQIGYVETHGRADTVRALKGLPVIPRKRVFYKGKEMEEMDLDAILQVHPEIVLVDELAHSNVEGQRHAKRWQDVMELLDAGINVLSAVNIQHEVLPRAYRAKGMSRMVVCVSSNSETQQHIIRKAARMADILDADLLALYVQTRDENNDRIPLDSQRHLMSHLELALRLGGQVHKVVSDNIPQSIAEFCRQQHATLLCMGQSSFSFPRLLTRARGYRKLLSELKEMGVDLVIPQIRNFVCCGL